MHTYYGVLRNILRMCIKSAEALLRVFTYVLKMLRSTPECISCLLKKILKRFQCASFFVHCVWLHIGSGIKFSTDLFLKFFSSSNSYLLSIISYSLLLSLIL